jgi:hypothetical protein
MDFSKDQLAIIYEAVKHMGFESDVLESDNYIGEISRDILDKIRKFDSTLASSWYVHDKILD